MTCNNPPWRPTFPLPVASVCWQSGPGVLSSSQHHLKQLAQQVEHDFHLQSAGAQDMKIKKYCFIRLSCFNFQTCDLFLFSSLAASLKFNYIDIPGSCPVQRSPPLLASLATFLDWRVVLEGISTWAKGSKSIILCLRFPTSSPTVQPLFAFSLRWILQSDFPRLNSRSLSFWFYSIFQVLCSLIHPNIYVWCCSALANHPVLQHQSQVLKIINPTRADYIRSCAAENTRQLLCLTWIWLQCCTETESHPDAENWGDSKASFSVQFFFSLLQRQFVMTEQRRSEAINCSFCRLHAIMVSFWSQQQETGGVWCVFKIDR